MKAAGIVPMQPFSCPQTATNRLCRLCWARSGCYPNFYFARHGAKQGASCEMSYCFIKYVLQFAILCCTIFLTVSARVQSDIKTEAEEILKNLGIPVSVLINSLYRQIIYKHGVPFELTIPTEPATMDALTKAELDRKLQHSYEQSLNGQGVSANRFFDELERDLT